MRVTAGVLVASAAFFAVAAAAYWVMTDEYAGIVLLVALVPSAMLLAAWLLGTARGRRPPEDRDDAEPADGTEEVGYFPSSSIWPLVVATGAVVTANALAFGIWLAVAGGVIVAVAVVGYAAEASAKA